MKIAESFHVYAKIIGRVEPSPVKKLTISTETGNYIY